MNQQDQANFMQEYAQKLESELSLEKTRNLDNEKRRIELSGFPPIKDQNLVEYQLDLKEEMDRLYHLLSGHILEPDKEGNQEWKEPTDDRLKVFSDYGVKQLMNLISFYLNRNTLLSSYDIETINWKMKDFGNRLSDLMLFKYEHFFYYPTPEELYDKFIPFIKSEKLNITEDELYWKCVQWSNEELKSRIRHYPMIILSLMDSIHSSYLRALKGEERRSLRQFIHVSQNSQSQMQQPIQDGRQFSLVRPSTWGKN